MDSESRAQESTAGPLREEIQGVGGLSARCLWLGAWASVGDGHPPCLDLPDRVVRSGGFRVALSRLGCLPTNSLGVFHPELAADNRESAFHPDQERLQLAAPFPGTERDVRTGHHLPVRGGGAIVALQADQLGRRPVVRHAGGSGATLPAVQTRCHRPRLRPSA